MTLTRVWTPTKSYSTGSTKRLLVVHDMEGFTGPNGAYDCATYFQGNVGASSQVCIDNNRGRVWECVSRHNASWTQCNYNSVAVSAELSGYASWSRDYWLSNRENELRNTADWIAEESAKFGIPIRSLTAGEAQGGGKGICQHKHLGSSGCGHVDCGDGFPMDTVIQWANEIASGSVPGIEEFQVAGIAYDGSGRPWEVGAWKNNGQLNVKVGDSPFAAIDKKQEGAKDPGIAYNPEGDSMRVIYVRKSDGVMCAYDTAVSPIDWRWTELGGSF